MLRDALFRKVLHFVHLVKLLAHFLGTAVALVFRGMGSSFSLCIRFRFVYLDGLCFVVFLEQVC